MTVHIGLLRPEHAGEALTVQLAAFVIVAQRYDAPHVPPLLETLDELRADLESGTPAFGAWLGARLTGFVRVRPNGTRMEISRLSVVPDLHGHGIGRALLSAAEAAAPPTVRTVWLQTGAASEGSVRLYRRAGYALVGETTDGAGIRMIVLEKPVNS